MLPANVEIIEPEEIYTNNNTLTDLLASVAIRINKYDEVARAMTVQKDQLLRKIKSMQEEINTLKPKDKDEKKDEDNTKKEDKAEKKDQDNSKKEDKAEK
jgi:hypothetical protein